MTVEKTEERLSALEEFRRDFPEVWKNIPFKGVFVSLLVLWVLLFEFLGNSTFGYIDTHSLFAWTSYSYISSNDDEHGFFIPFIVLGLLWWKRNDFRSLSARPWLPALALIAFALALHVVGYLGQQARISLAAFFFGLYALCGVVWGPAVLKATFFPMCLFAFALPLGTLAETITFPMRLFATWFTGNIAHVVLGIDVVHQGTLIFDPSGTYQYEVAAACGGLRSLTAVLALCTIFGFMNFSKWSNRLIMLAAAFPLAILGNMTRLLGLIVVSEAFGAETGHMVHDNTWFSLLPYVPPIVGIVMVGHFLREQTPGETVEKPAPEGADPFAPRAELTAKS